MCSAGMNRPRADKTDGAEQMQPISRPHAFVVNNKMPQSKTCNAYGGCGRLSQDPLHYHSFSGTETFCNVLGCLFTRFEEVHNEGVDLTRPHSFMSSGGSNFCKCKKADTHLIHHGGQSIEQELDINASHKFKLDYVTGKCSQMLSGSLGILPCGADENDPRHAVTEISYTTTESSITFTGLRPGIYTLIERDDLAELMNKEKYDKEKSYPVKIIAKAELLKHPEKTQFPSPHKYRPYPFSKQCAHPHCFAEENDVIHKLADKVTESPVQASHSFVGEWLASGICRVDNCGKLRDDSVHKHILNERAEPSELPYVDKDKFVAHSRGAGGGGDCQVLDAQDAILPGTTHEFVPTEAEGLSLNEASPLECSVKVAKFGGIYRCGAREEDTIHVKKAARIETTRFKPIETEDAIASTKTHKFMALPGGGNCICLVIDERGITDYCGKTFFDAIHLPSNEQRALPTSQTQMPKEIRERVNHPNHYGGDIVHETIKCLADWGLEAFALRWNAVKYLSRAHRKENELEDLKKAKWYLDKEIERLEKAKDGTQSV